MVGRVPYGFWDEKQNRIAYLKWLGKQLQYKTPEDWYAIQRKHFAQNHGGGILGMCFRDSPQTAVRELFPDYPWQPWLFVRTPQGYWQSADNRRNYMRWLTKKLKLRTKEDLYQLCKNDFMDNGGAGLLGNHYQWSILAAVQEYKPLMNLLEWKFQSVPQGFWNSDENRIRYMDWLSEKLRIRTPELWYRVTTEEVEQNHGITLLTRFGGSIYRMAQDHLPHFAFRPWLFDTTPTGFWDAPNNRQTYLRWLGETLNFRRPADWYDLHCSHFSRTGATHLYAAFYRYSLLAAARERYPNYKWKPERFQQPT